jgi:hypothetical protein
MQGKGHGMTIRENLASHPIRAFALLCVAVTSGFLAYLALLLIRTLSSPNWCSTALQAERITAKDTFVGLTACVDLLKIQLNALALNSQIVIGTFAMCLGVLVVIVIAGAKLAGKGPGGIEVAIDAQQAADRVAGAAVHEADHIKDETP